MFPFQIGFMQNGDTLILVSKSLNQSLIQRLNNVRFQNESMEQARTWAMVKLYLKEKEL